jgi:hypothetical protein
MVNPTNVTKTREELVKGYLNEEIQRSMGANFNDFSLEDQEGLIEIYHRVGNVKDAVREWALG